MPNEVGTSRGAELYTFRTAQLKALRSNSIVALLRHACHLISEAVHSQFLERQLSRSVNKPHIEAAREG
jgi:hypothetical protein